MVAKFLKSPAFFGTSVALALVLSGCSSFIKDERSRIVVSVRDQKMLLLQDGKPVKTYKISTSKFGLGDRPGSNCTPLGRMEVAKKIGGTVEPGAVFKQRIPTGEVVRPNSPGRDPIVSRIMWLAGKETSNKNTYRRCIYIHGTPEEQKLGTPASYGCVRMTGLDVADLYNRVGTGAEVQVMRSSLADARSSGYYVDKDSVTAKAKNGQNITLTAR